MTLVVAIPMAASASNMTHPRTPVVWDNTPCMTLHDRGNGAVMHVPYAIPNEDIEVTKDEVADSRTHQFFAYCRPHHPQNYLPGWITQVDVDAAALLGLVEKGLDAEGILESNTEWEDCWFRINEDADRRPITYAMAEAGVDWDTADVPAGVYTLYGYTYEPVFNVWHLRPGVVKVHDGDPLAVGPAAAISVADIDDTTPYRDEELLLPSCVNAAAGSTYTTYWALTDADPTWEVYEADLEVPGETFDVAFTPPEGLWGESGLIRLDITEPGGSTYTAYVSEPIVTINADNPDACDQGGGFIGSPCEDSSGGGDTASSGGDDDNSDGTASTTDAATTGGTSGGTTDATGPMQTGGDEGTGGESCGCVVDDDRSWRAALLLLVPLAMRRRRAR